MYCIYTCIDCLVVHFYDCITLLTIGFLCSSFHEVYSLFDRHNVCKFEECGLENRVGTFAHSDFDCLVDCVDGVKLDVVVSDVFLSFCI